MPSKAELLIEFRKLEQTLQRKPQCRDSRKLHHRAVSCPELGSWSALVRQAAVPDPIESLKTRYWQKRHALGRRLTIHDDPAFAREAVYTYTMWSKFLVAMGETPPPNCKLEDGPRYRTQRPYHTNLIPLMAQHVQEHGNFPRTNGKAWDPRDVPEGSPLPNRSTFVRAFGSMREVERLVFEHFFKKEIA